MAYILTLLDDESSVVEGDPVDLHEPQSRFTLQRTVTGSPSTATVHLEGSLDGVNWNSLGDSGSSGSLFSVSTHAVRYVRGRVSAFSGTGTVSARVAVDG